MFADRSAGALAPLDKQYTIASLPMAGKELILYSFDGWNDYCRASLGKGQSGNLPRNLAITLRDFGARELLTRPARCRM